MDYAKIVRVLTAAYSTSKQQPAWLNKDYMKQLEVDDYAKFE